MRIEIEIPKEFEGDYNKDKFDEFFGRVLCDIADGTMCGRYEKETAQMLKKAFEESKIAHDVEAMVAELEKRANDNDRAADRLCGIENKKKIASWRARAQAFRDAISIVRGKE